MGDLSSIPGLGRIPGGGHDYPLQDSYLENPHGQRSLLGYSQWGRKEPDVTKHSTAYMLDSRIQQQVLLVNRVYESFQGLTLLDHLRKCSEFSALYIYYSIHRNAAQCKI